MKYRLRGILSILAFGLGGGMLGLIQFLAWPAHYTSSAKLVICAGTPDYVKADVFVNRIYGDIYGRKSLGGVIQAFSLFSREREYGPLEDVMDEYLKLHQSLPVGPEVLPARYFERLGVEFTYRDSATARKVADELFRRAIAYGSEYSRKEQDFRGYSLVPVNEPEFAGKSFGEYTWKGILRLDAPVDLRSDAEAIKRRFEEIRYQVLSPGSISELMQRPTVGICHNDNLEDCLPRERHEITFDLHGGTALIKFTADTAQHAQMVVSALVTKTLDLDLVQAREKLTNDMADHPSSQDDREARSEYALRSVILGDSATLPDYPDGPDFLVLSGAMAVAGAFLRFIWQDGGHAPASAGK